MSRAATTDAAGPLEGARLVIAVTAPSSATFYAGQLAALRRAGADVYLLSSPSDEVAQQCHDEGAGFLPIEMERAASPFSDARALASVTAALHRLRPNLVNAGTPKAGLLGMLAAAALKIPTRVHTLHGLRYEAATGLRRQILWLAQRTSCDAATHVMCVSRSLRDRAVETGLLQAGRGVVIGDGSVNGVDTRRFCSGPEALLAGASFRARLGISERAPLVGYIGRIARDKGIGELATAWMAPKPEGARLIIAGEIDDTDPPDANAIASIRGMPGIVHAGHLHDPVGFYAAIDVLALPTYREGFPTVLLEAAAMGVPVVSTFATGCVDAVIDGVTGTLVPIGDPFALATAINAYLNAPTLRMAHGHAARERARTQYDCQRVHRLTVEFYQSLLTR